MAKTKKNTVGDEQGIDLGEVSNSTARVFRKPLYVKALQRAAFGRLSAVLQHDLQGFKPFPPTLQSSLELDPRCTAKRVADCGFTVVKDANGHRYVRGPRPNGDGVRLYEHGDQSTVLVVSKILYDRGKGCPDGAIKRVLDQLAAVVASGSDHVEVAVRFAERPGAIYVNLGGGRVARATAAGWDVGTYPEVAFFEPPKAHHLPDPKPGGSLDVLRGRLRLADDEWEAFRGFLLGSVKSKGHHLVLLVVGPGGSGKSTLCKAAAGILDPGGTPALKMGFSSEQVYVAARNCGVLVIDEYNRPTPDKLETLKSIATGSAFSVRRMGKNAEEFSYAVNNPIAINGTGPLLLADDAFVSRCVVIHKTPLPGERRTGDAEDMGEFLKPVLAEAWGGLLDLVVAGLRNADPGYPPARRPRMAGAADWVCRCLTGASLDPVRFLDVLERGQRQPSAPTPAATWPLGAVIADLAARRFEGSPTDLFNAVKAHPACPPDVARMPNPNQLTHELNAHADDVNALGVRLRREVKHGGKTWVTLVLGATPDAVVAGATVPVECVIAESPLPLAERLRRLEEAAPDLLPFAHGNDNVYRVYGRFAETAARLLGRPVEDGPSLRMSETEFDGLYSQLGFASTYQL